MTRWPSITSIELLIAEEAHGSISAAATRLGISQASASRRLDRLERDLGTSLLTRSHTGTTLTEQGRRVVEAGHGLLAAAREVTRAASDGPMASSTIFVAASLTVAEHLLPRWIRHFHAHTDQARIRPQIGNSEFVVSQLMSNRAELGFLEDIAAHPEMVSRTVAHDQMCMVVPAGHPWTRRTGPVARSEVAAAGLVVREVGSGTRALVDTYLRDMSDDIELHEYTSNTAVTVAVRSGVAPTITSELVVADEIATGELAAVPFEGPPLVREIRAVWPHRRRLTGPALEFLRIAEVVRDDHGRPVASRRS
jgi:molybdate transport repressor ModE-like protein